MTVLDLDFRMPKEFEERAKKAVLENGMFVYSRTWFLRTKGTNRVERFERRIVRYNDSYYLLQICHAPCFEATGKWEIFKKSLTGRVPEGPLRISDTNNASADEIGCEQYAYNNNKLEAPKVEWMTKSIMQMSREERRQVGRHQDDRRAAARGE